MDILCIKESWYAGVISDCRRISSSMPSCPRLAWEKSMQKKSIRICRFAQVIFWLPRLWGLDQFYSRLIIIPGSSLDGVAIISILQNLCDWKRNGVARKMFFLYSKGICKALLLSYCMCEYRNHTYRWCFPRDDKDLLFGIRSLYIVSGSRFLAFYEWLGFTTRLLVERSICFPRGFLRQKYIPWS